MRKLLWPLILLLTLSAQAQQHPPAPNTSTAESRKTGVRIVHKGEDAVGTRFVYQLREEIAKSARYKLFTGDLDKLQPGSGLPEIEVITLDTAVEEEQQGINSALSILMQFKIKRPAEEHGVCGSEDTIIGGHWLLVVGGKRVDDQAKATLADLDRLMEGLN